MVDLETTGLDPRSDEIISFAAIPVDEGRVRPGGLVSGLVRPRRMPRADTMRIHGLRPADLETAPVLRDALDRCSSHSPRACSSLTSPWPPASDSRSTDRTTPTATR